MRVSENAKIYYCISNSIQASNSRCLKKETSMIILCWISGLKNRSLTHTTHFIFYTHIRRPLTVETRISLVHEILMAQTCTSYYVD